MCKAGGLTRALVPPLICRLAVLCGLMVPMFAAGLRSAEADGYPSRQVRIVLPYAAGGGADMLTRLLAQGLSEIWHQAVIVDNRPGAGAILGTDVAAKATPDGYTLLMTAGTLAVSPSAYPNLPYKVPGDFAPITLVARTPFVLVVYPKIKANSVAELVALARREPGKLNFGSAGNGTMAHLSVELLKVRTGIDIVHIPYKGSNPALNDLLAGQFDAVFDTPAAVMPHVKAGELRALAVSTAERSPSLPELPTMEEAGVPDFDVSVWYALLAPAGTPDDIVGRVQGDAGTVLRDGAVRTKLVAQGLETIPSTTAAFSTFLDGEIKKWSTVIHAAGIKFD